MGCGGFSLFGKVVAWGFFGLRARCMSCGEFSLFGEVVAWGIFFVLGVICGYLTHD